MCTVAVINLVNLVIKPSDLLFMSLPVLSRVTQLSLHYDQLCSVKCFEGILHDLVH